MFSFVGDTVLDPFCGTGTTMAAALRTNRNSIGVEIDPEYCRMAGRCLRAEAAGLFETAKLAFERVDPATASLVEDVHTLETIRPARRKLA
jgi:site-specific DNA-methyltransferase (adenine-specific)